MLRLLRLGLALAVVLAPAVPARDGAERLLCLHGPLSEIAVLLGREEALVGADTTALWPARLQSLPSVGYVRNLSAEGVLSLRPGLVLLDDKAGPPHVVDQLRRLGMRLVDVEAPTEIDGVVPRILRMGEVLAVPERARDLAEAVAADLAATRGVAPEGERCLFVFHPRGAALMAGGRDTPAQALLDHLGLANVMTAEEGWVRLEPESAIAAAPTVIVTTSDQGSPDEALAAVLDAPGLGATPAAREGRIIVLDTMAALGFAPRVGPELLKLAAALDPARELPASRAAPLLLAAERGTYAESASGLQGKEAQGRAQERGGP